MVHKIRTIRDIRNLVKQELREYLDERELDSVSLIITRHLTGISALHELLSSDRKVTSSEAKRAIEICRELKTGKPVQYVLGITDFYGCRIKLSGKELIPRPETEELVDIVLRENPGFTGKIIDIGTGSGCIAIALAVHLPLAEVTAIDISWQALQSAKENADLNKARINLLREDILNSKFSLPGGIDIIVSNPPYVRESEKKMMNRNVLDYEPPEALFVPDSDPLKFYRAILRLAEKSLNSRGKIYFEINEALGNEMKSLLEMSGYSEISVVRDLNSKDRIAKAVKNA